MRISHLNALRALEATLRQGSFTKAAQELGITPAAVGQRVRVLEEYLGAELFDRSGASTVPTESAKDVGYTLTRGFMDIAKALDALSPNSETAPLRVTAPESFTENWLAPALVSFRAQHPGLELHLEPTNRDVDLEGEDFDLAIRFGQGESKRLKTRTLFGDQVIPVCTPAFARHHNLHPDQKSLEGVPQIFVGQRTSDPGWVGFEEWGAAFGFAPEHLSNGLRISKTGSGLQAAIAGHGLVLCGLVEAFNALKAGMLVLPFGPTSGFKAQYDYRLVWANSKPGHKSRQNFVDWVIEQSDGFVADLNRFMANP